MSLISTQGDSDRKSRDHAVRNSFNFWISEKKLCKPRVKDLVRRLISHEPYAPQGIQWSPLSVRGTFQDSWLR